MPRPNSGHRLTCALVLGLLCINGPVACSPRQASTPPSVSAEADPADAAAVGEEGAATERPDEPPETCEGALDCTFFGLGAVLAAPFWVLAVVLGMAF